MNFTCRHVFCTCFYHPVSPDNGRICRHSDVCHVTFYHHVTSCHHVTYDHVICCHGDLYHLPCCQISEVKKLILIIQNKWTNFFKIHENSKKKLLDILNEWVNVAQHQVSKFSATVYQGENKLHYMTSDNVFSDWLTSLETFFDKTIYSPHTT